jgi:hypothetical protein
VREPPGARGPGVSGSGRYAGLLAAAVLTLSVGACGGPPPSSAPSTVSLVYGKGALRNVSCTHVPGPAVSCGGLLPSLRGISDRIVLDTNVARAGTPIHGDLVVTNVRGSTVELRDPHGCRPGYAVGLTGATLPAGNAPAFAAVCSAEPLVLPQGTTRFPIDVITTWSGCTNGPPPTSARYRIPRCTAHGEPPPLPAGRYVAVLYGSALALPPATAPVTLTAGA